MCLYKSAGDCDEKHYFHADSVGRETEGTTPISGY